ncbi:sulfatase-like hydrolase/transferase [Aestuariivivens sediminis]|uniref:sulfatase-like hydrolase/transferase n=1 Tax=Aestuariivivens sediminis TaxID=2913557 RepID=UPI001F55DA54|nr:sulfatase-like hydrolase/transferase [Aestuariivivens sediminis]
MIHRFLKITVILIWHLNLSAQPDKPNIVLIMADDLGFECISANGGTSYQTPNIDRLVSQGMRFENCHAQPLCTPSRVQIMTGKYNVRNYTKFGELDRGEITFGNYFKQAGYKTAIAGKWQLGKEADSPQHFGFDQSCLWQQSKPRTDDDGHDTRFSNPVLEINGTVKHFGNGAYGPDIVSDFICDFIEKNKEDPFFAYYPMLLTHCPFTPTPASEDWDPESPGSLDYKGKPRYFPEMVSYMDRLVGKVVSKIEALGLSENTIILFTGDNGTDKPIVSMFRGNSYPGGKGQTTDHGTHVPLVVQWTGTIEAAKECHDLIDFSDVLPTLCEAAQIDLSADETIDGRSFLSQLLGKKGSPREWIYSWYSRSGSRTNLKEFARTTEYKLYKTGGFYKVTNDVFEDHPIATDDMTEEEKDINNTLTEVLKYYDYTRE